MASNFTVKAADETTDLAFTLLQQPAGIQPAIWTGSFLSSTRRFAPEIRFMSRPGNAGARKMRLDFTYPYVVTIDGVEQVISRLNADLNWVLPDTMPSGQSNTAAHIFAHAMHVFAGPNLATGYVS